MSVTKNYLDKAFDFAARLVTPNMYVAAHMLPEKIVGHPPSTLEQTNILTAVADAQNKRLDQKNQPKPQF